MSLAASNVLGTVVSDGDFRMNASLVTGTATLFEGSAVESGRAPSRLDLSRAWMLLAADSKVRVTSTRLFLERGTGETGGERPLEMEARTLRVVPSGARASARVKLDGANVLVGALNGPVKVQTGGGVLLAMVPPGSTLSFEPQAANSDAYDLNGCLLWKANHHVLFANGQEFILDGEKLAPMTGNRVHVTGKSINAQGLMVIRVTTAEQTGSGGCLAAAQATGGSLAMPGASAPPTAGKETAKQGGGGSNKMVIAGVAIAGAAAAIAVPLATSKKSGTS
jgi:hypothetical protein